MQNDQKILNALIRQDFSSFIAKAFQAINPGTEYHDNWHINLIADYLEAVRLGHIRRLIINMPPRALKSVCVSVAWPAWLLAHNPAIRVMAACYSAVLSTKHSLDCRFVMEAQWYQQLFPGTVLSKKQNQKTKFLTSENGFRFATSIGGSATGEGGDVLIIDDPHNPTHIHSANMRNKAIEWFEQTFVTRLNNKNTGAIVLVMQRLHENDLAGHLLSSGHWEHLHIPAIADRSYIYQPYGGGYYHYQAGEILNQKRDQLEFLNNIEHEIGTRNFAAQFLQSPLPANLSFLALEDISFYQDKPAQLDYYILSWDTALKVSEQSDYSVGTCWGSYNNRFYLMDMVRQKLRYPELKDQVKKQILRYKPRYILVEDKASGQSLIQDLLLENFKGIKPIKPKQDKVTRFASSVPFFQAGILLLPRSAGFKHDLLQELLNFPNTAHDDIIDSVSQFCNFIKMERSKNAPNIRRF